jgi:fibronectin type 3 domain-containing protein
MAKKVTILLVAVLIAVLGAARLKSGFKAHGHHRVNLNWQAPAAKPGAPVKSYNVYRSTTSGSQYVRIASGVPEARYVDTTVSSGKTYYYVVTSVDAVGHESGFSAEIKATVP